MTARQKRIQSYIIVTVIAFAVWGDTVYKYAQKGRDYSIKMEQKTGQHWIMNLEGKPLGDD